MKPAPQRGAKQTAMWMLRNSLWPVPTHFREKRPIGKSWGLRRPERSRLIHVYETHKGAGVGVKLGPDADVIDFEIDDLVAAGPLLERLTLPETVSWRSSRGRHRLYRWTEKLAGLPTVVHLDGAELRIGGEGKQTMSVVPPTVGDDRLRRTWGACWEISELPGCLLREIEKVQDTQHKRTERPICWTQDSRYALAALRYEAEAVAKAPKGARNTHLNRSAFVLGTLVGAGMLTRETVETALTEAALSNGLGEVEIARTLRSGLDAGIKRPRKG